MMAPLARPEVVRDAFKAEERQWSDMFWAHVAECQDGCDDGGCCPVGDDYAGRADVAGLNWQEADRRLKREARPC